MCSTIVLWSFPAQPGFCHSSLSVVTFLNMDKQIIWPKVLSTLLKHAKKQSFSNFHDTSKKLIWFHLHRFYNYGEGEQVVRSWIIEMDDKDKLLQPFRYCHYTLCRVIRDKWEVSWKNSLHLTATHVWMLTLLLLVVLGRILKWYCKWLLIIHVQLT